MPMAADLRVAMAATRTRSDTLRRSSTATTLIDAILEFSKGRHRAGALLLAAAAVSTKVPGFGTAVSLLLRVYRRVR